MQRIGFITRCLKLGAPVLIFACATAIAEPRALADSPVVESTSIREQILVTHLEAAAAVPGRMQYLRVVIGAGMVAAGGVIAFGPQTDIFGYSRQAEARADRWRWPAAGALGVLGALDLATLALPEAVQWATDDFQLSLLALGTAVGSATQSDSSGKWYGTGVLAGTAIALAGISAYDLAERQAARAQLADARKKLGTGSGFVGPALRDGETVLYRAMHHPPLWTVSVVFAVGGLVTLAPVLLDLVPKRDQDMLAYLGTTQLLAAGGTLVPSLIGDNEYERYVKALRAVRLSPVGPAGTAGVTLRVRF